ncbi:hypothetical protein DFP72DRAFT_1139380 [Ephemerocybe angulata]|uniref:Uncharacterized protein n=1 Tax=Ephemerocybe angulata TaxID=980116 RepID=A0A8H6HQ26_9AGAR|nr:hypothetical protein DFP72DRAFT_1139380 [Tulosesus angulatus]
MRFATTLTLFSALILSGSNVLAVPLPATDIDHTSLAARDLSYESTVEARGFDFDALTLEERGLRSGLQKLKNKVFGGSNAPPPDSEVQRRELELELLERGLRSGLRNLKNKVFGSNQSAAPDAEIQRRELEEELLQRGLRSGLRNLKNKVFGSNQAAAPSSPDAESQRRELEELLERRSGTGNFRTGYSRRREELVQRGLRTALRRRQLEREIVERGSHQQVTERTFQSVPENAPGPSLAFPAQLVITAAVSSAVKLTAVMISVIVYSPFYQLVPSTVVMLPD